MELAKEVEDHKAEEDRLAEDGKRQVVPASTGLLLVTLHSCRVRLNTPIFGIGSLSLFRIGCLPFVPASEIKILFVFLRT